MPSRVADYINSFTPANPTLPLTHVTTLHGFREIAQGKSLIPSHCKFFDEELLYLFYGRPSYRSTQEAASDLLWNAPVGFIIDHRKVSKIKRVFPFDTGAFKGGLYGKVFAPASPIEEFKLTPDFLSIQKYTAAFFEDNETYMKGRSRKHHEIRNFDFEIQGLAYLSSLNGQQSFSNGRAVDERASAIEIQIAGDLPLESAVLGLIVPEEILMDEIFLEAVDKWKISSEKIIPYANVLGPGSEAWIGQFFQKTIEFYRSMGLLR